MRRPVRGNRLTDPQTLHVPRRLETDGLPRDGTSIARWGLCMVMAVCLGCLGPIEGLYPPRADEPTKTVFLVNHNDWHAGIVVNIKDIPDHLWPEHRDVEGFDYVEVGWGDRDYYQAAEPTVWITLKAAFWPTPSVLHVTWFIPPVRQYFPGSEVIDITLSQGGFERLVTFIHESYARDGGGRAIRLGPGLYEHSRFYSARRTFHLLRTCNVWTAKAIRSAGCPITPLYAVTARNVMYQAKKCRKVARVASGSGPWYPAASATGMTADVGAEAHGLTGVDGNHE